MFRLLETPDLMAASQVTFCVCGLSQHCGCCGFSRVLFEAEMQIFPQTPSLTAPQYGPVPNSRLIQKIRNIMDHLAATRRAERR